MPSFVIHGLIPPLVFLALGFRRRLVLLLWPLTYLPDLDHFVGVPRASLHNLLVLVPPLVGLWLAHRRPEYAHRREVWGLAVAYLASHLVMDGFNGGWTPLFPFWDATFLVTFYVLVRQPDNVIHEVVFEWGVRQGPPTLSAIYPWITPFDVAMVMFVAMAFAVEAIVRRRRAAAGEEGGGDETALR